MLHEKGDNLSVTMLVFLEESDNVLLEETDKISIT